MNSRKLTVIMLISVLFMVVSAVMAQDGIFQYALAETDLPAGYELIETTTQTSSQIPSIQQTWKTPSASGINTTLLSLADYSAAAGGSNGAMLGLELNEGTPVTVNGADRVINSSYEFMPSVYVSYINAQKGEFIATCNDWAIEISEVITLLEAQMAKLSGNSAATTTTGEISAGSPGFDLVPILVAMVASVTGYKRFKRD